MRRMLLLPIILAGVAVALVLKYFEKKKKANDEGLGDEAEDEFLDTEDEYDESEEFYDEE